MILATKLRNELKRIKPEGLEFHIKNISHDGYNKLGCSGFIKNNDNGKIVYVNTENTGYEPIKDKNLYREAKSLKDYTGGRNFFAENKDLAKSIMSLLV